MLKAWKNHGLPFLALSVCVASIICGYLGARASPIHARRSRQLPTALVQGFKVPLAFEQNTGQAALEAKYISRGPGYVLFLTDAQAVFEFSSVSGSAGNSCKTGSSTLESITGPSCDVKSLIRAGTKTRAGQSASAVSSQAW